MIWGYHYFRKHSYISIYTEYLDVNSSHPWSFVKVFFFPQPWELLGGNFRCSSLVWSLGPRGLGGYVDFANINPEGEVCEDGFSRWDGDEASTWGLCGKVETEAIFLCFYLWDPKMDPTSTLPGWLQWTSPKNDRLLRWRGITAAIWKA